jgi:hypothetical protein
MIRGAIPSRTRVSTHPPAQADGRKRVDWIGRADARRRRDRP